MPSFYLLLPLCSLLDHVVCPAQSYPPETVLFTALPMLCISSPMPRIVAHPSEAKTTKSNDQKSNFFFIFDLRRTIDSRNHAYAATALTENWHYRVGRVHSANSTVKFRLLLINRFFAQLYSMLLGLLFSFEQLAFDSVNLNERSELPPIVNNTN